MRRDAALQAITALLPRAKGELGVRSLALFGSVARDEGKADSDIDVLVEFEPPPSFDRMPLLEKQKSGLTVGGSF